MDSASIEQVNALLGTIHDLNPDATIVKAMISLAHNLGLKVIAEGAESEEQVAFLREHACDQVQGFYFSRPVGFRELLEQLQPAALTASCAAALTR